MAQIGSLVNTMRADSVTFRKALRKARMPMNDHFNALRRMGENLRVRIIRDDEGNVVAFEPFEEMAKPNWKLEGF